MIITPGIAPMLRSLDPLHINGEPQIRDPGSGRWIAHMQGVESEHGDGADESVEAEGAEAGEGLVRIDDAVFVAVPEGYVLASVSLFSGGVAWWCDISGRRKRHCELGDGTKISDNWMGKGKSAGDAWMAGTV